MVSYSSDFLPLLCDISYDIILLCDASKHKHQHADLVLYDIATHSSLIVIDNFFFIPLKVYKTNYLLQYLLITLRNTTRTIIPRGAIYYDNPVAINIERNKKIDR